MATVLFAETAVLAAVSHIICIGLFTRMPGGVPPSTDSAALSRMYDLTDRIVIADGILLARIRTETTFAGPPFVGQFPNCTPSENYGPPKVLFKATTQICDAAHGTVLNYDADPVPVRQVDVVLPLWSIGLLLIVIAVGFGCLANHRKRSLISGEPDMKVLKTFPWAASFLLAQLTVVFALSFYQGLGLGRAVCPGSLSARALVIRGTLIAERGRLDLLLLLDPGATVPANSGQVAGSCRELPRRGTTAPMFQFRRDLCRAEMTGDDFDGSALPTIVDRYRVRFPLILPVSLFAFPPGLAVFRSARATRRRKRGECEGCGYKLFEGGSIQCPECGLDREHVT